MEGIEKSGEVAKPKRGFQKGHRLSPGGTSESAKRAWETKRLNQQTLAVQKEANTVMAAQIVETLGDVMVKATEAAIKMCAEFVANEKKPDETRLRAAGILTQQGWAAAPKKTVALNVNTTILNERFSSEDLQGLAKRYLDTQSGGGLLPTSAENLHAGRVVDAEVASLPTNRPTNNV